MRPSKLPKDISESLGKLPPQAIDMEEAVLGAVLLEKNAIDMVPNLRPEHFYKESHIRIYQAILQLKEANEPINMRTAIMQLRKNGTIEQIGGALYIAELTSKVSASDGIDTHAAMIIEMSIKRGLIEIASNIHMEAYEDTTDCFELVDKLKDQISRIEVRNTMDVYLQPSTSTMYQEYKDGKKLGHYCQIEALKDIFCWVPSFLMGLTGMSNKGKAQWIETEIPTPNGFVKMKDIQVGDTVFDELGNQCKVTFVTPIQYGKKCYKITFNDSSLEYCCEDHLWKIYGRGAVRAVYKYSNEGVRNIKPRGTDQSHKRKTPVIMSTREISSNVYGRPVPSSPDYQKHNYAVKLAEPIKCDKANLEIPPYVLGIWLGDGLSGSSRIASNDQQVIDEINKLGVNTSKQNAPFIYGLLGISRFFKELGLFNNKHIPDKYLFADYDQRLELLRGLMDSDGYIGVDGCCELSFIKERLSHDARALICSLGIKASIIKSDAKLYGRVTSDRYRIRFKTTLPVFKLQRKLDRMPARVKKSQIFRTIVSCEEIESLPVKCIQVNSESHLYLTSRSFIPTHNTTFDSFMMLMAAKVDGRRWGIWSPEMITSENESKDRRKPKIVKKATQIYYPLIKSYTGQNPYPYFPNQMNPDVFEDARKFVEEHFYVIDTGRDRDYMTVIDALRWATLEFNLYGWVIDPFKNLEWEEGNKTKDRILQRVLDEFKYLAVETNTVGQLILHPRQMNEKELREGGNLKGPYRVMTQFDLLGGSVWSNGVDSLHSYYRPFVHEDPNSPHASLYNLRQKMQDVTVKPGAYEGIYYEIDTNRFYFNGVCPINGSKLRTSRASQASMWDEMRRKYNEEPVKAAVVNDDENPFQ